MKPIRTLLAVTALSALTPITLHTALSETSKPSQEPQYGGRSTFATGGLISIRPHVIVPPRRLAWRSVDAVSAQTHARLVQLAAEAPRARAARPPLAVPRCMRDALF